MSGRTAAGAPPAEQLRHFVVRTVVLAIVALTFLLYLAAAVLLAVAAHKGGTDNLEQAVPAWLTLAAGNASGALVTLLLNSKGGAEQGTTTVTTPDTTVDVQPPGG